ncbi:hypothetical protein BC829DRAFT_382909, partial [Chytridium lagenaria]
MTPSLFTGLVVVFLLLFTLSCVFVTSVLYSMTKGRKTVREVEEEDVNWMKARVRVVGVSGREASDVGVLRTTVGGMLFGW